MEKHIYKAFFLVVVFISSLFFMSRNIKEEEILLEKTVVMEEAAFPLMYVKVNDITLNRLHGYASNMDANIVREATTPVSQEKEIFVCFQENETVIKKIKYELRALKDNELLDTGSISALEETEGGKSAKIRLNANLETSTEYAMKITVVSDEGRKIYFYTRVKYYDDDSGLKQKIDFVMNFNEKSFHKNKAKELAPYLETDHLADTTNYAVVDIHSGMDMISWGEMKPEVLTERVPTIKEYTKETASVQLEYFIRVKNDSGDEIYNIKEFYRIRYTTDRMYLLNFERSMESQFDVELTSMAKSEFKFGVTKDEDIPFVTSAENSKVAFVRNGGLWYYNLGENKIVRVFSFDNGEDYLRAKYDQHDIQILNMDDSGSIDFVVYGYMNRGDYEGKVALILYHYSSDTNRIKENVYIPLETTYQMLKEDISDFSYVSEKGVYYFTIDNRVYSYNISARRLKILVEDLSEDEFAVLENGKGIAWVSAKQKETIHIMDLESEATKEIHAEEGERIRIFGSIESDMIYGFVKEKDIVETTQGMLYVPAYRLQISDLEGNVVKDYAQKGIYIVDSEMNGNVIRLSRVKKSDNGYRQVSDDSILTKGDTGIKIISIETRTTDLMLTEKYLSLPDGFVMPGMPKVGKTSHIILSEDTTLHLREERSNGEKYYVYAGGTIEGVYESAAEAVCFADERMGVVVNEENRIIYERGGKYNHKVIGQLKEIRSGEGVTTIGACISSVFLHNQIRANAKDISKDKRSILAIMGEQLKVINFTGCTLEQILYCVSSGNPVIAMKDGSHAVLILGYDESSVTYFDPMEGSKKESLKRAQEMFEMAGNVYIGYIK